MNDKLEIVQNIVKSLLEMNDDWNVDRIDYQAVRSGNGELLYWRAYIFTDTGVMNCLSNGEFF